MRQMLLAAVAMMCGMYGPASGAQQIALTFDDLPTTGELPKGETRLGIAERILAALKGEHLPPVYGMVNGDKVAADPATMKILQAWRAAGQPLGSHTWSHMNLNEHTAEEFDTDIAKNEPLLGSLMGGEDWHWFRYPFLWEGDTMPKRQAVRMYLQTHGYHTAQVTMDFEDYLWNAPYARCVAKHDAKGVRWLETSYLDTARQYATFYRTLSKSLYGREIPYVLLLHIGAMDAHMLPRLIALYRAEGFAFTTLEKAQADPAYAEDPAVALKYGGPLTEQMMEKRGLKLPPNTKPYQELEGMCR